ncbi:hypothetical protein RDV64_18745 [Acuticoccus sp. MNP-M23]|uniref:hypothetical protein n=1 Tax=Acuticoccus sp. MNP-M23 TaxID=3072793 RepID=UPI00281652A3|nr:hypothetical protein [Acuticoccus sp. MNP-M23]WMS42085.1 hypothetical protein RDV64_18745 [Acuticoccus sp. MNP-M23]
MEFEAKERCWQEIDRISTGVLVHQPAADRRALPVNGFCCRRSSVIELYASLDAAEGLELQQGMTVCINFADAIECVFVSLQASISGVDCSGNARPAADRKKSTPCSVGSGVMIAVRPLTAEFWEPPGRGFMDALDILTQGTNDSHTLSAPRTIRF